MGWTVRVCGLDPFGWGWKKRNRVQFQLDGLLQDTSSLVASVRWLGSTCLAHD